MPDNFHNFHLFNLFIQTKPKNNIFLFVGLVFHFVDSSVNSANFFKDVQMHFYTYFDIFEGSQLTIIKVFLLAMVLSFFYCFVLWNFVSIVI